MINKLPWIFHLNGLSQYILYYCEVLDYKNYFLRSQINYYYLSAWIYEIIEIKMKEQENKRTIERKMSSRNLIWEKTQIQGEVYAFLSFL